MQAVKELEQVTLCNKLSGYQLCTQLIRNGKRLGLKSSELLVFTALASYWNGKPVYPKINTLSDNTALSEKAVRTALNGLLEKGYIIKSKRGKNANVYNINVNAVLSTIQSGKNDLSSAVNSTAPMIMKLDHEKLEQQHVAVVSLKDFKGVEEETTKEESCTADSVSSEINLNEIPLCLKRKSESGIIRNLGGYWRSLRPAVKMEYIEQDRKEREAAERKAELKRQNEERKAAELEAERKRKEELAKPLEEQWTKEEAIKHIWTMRKMIKERHIFRTGMVKQLAEAFKLDIDEIISMPDI